MKGRTIRQSSNLWKNIPSFKVDPIQEMQQIFVKDPSPQKVTLIIGAYSGEDGKPWVLPSVNQAVQKIFSDAPLPSSYLPMEGDPEFTKEAIKILYGFDRASQTFKTNVNLNKIARVQTLSGTGAVRTAFLTVQKFYKHFDGKIWTPNASWPLHEGITKDMGLETAKYHYYDLENRKFDTPRYLDSLRSIPQNAFVIIHSSGHNPTGYDISPEDWEQVAKIAKERNFLVLMDTAYQGFVSGNLDDDVQGIHKMIKHGVPIIASQSFSKNMGLYGQRAGCLSVICEDEKTAAEMNDFFKFHNRFSYSCPPRFGSDIAKTILQNDDLYAQWQKDIMTMATNIKNRRLALQKILMENECPGDWNYITQQKGMFAFTQLQKDQCKALREKHSVYVVENGRLCISGINPGNVEYVGNAITDIMKSSYSAAC